MPESSCLRTLLPQNFKHFEKKGELYSLNSWEVIDSKKRRWLNARKLLFQNTLPESKCSPDGNTAEISLAGPLSKFSINLRQIQGENISVSPI